jgi:NAD(P)-dependent dehydrogenase (short-subunit alcohol dehydrogenase family)
MDAPCLLIPGDVGSPDFCRSAVRAVMDAYGRLDVLVNNAAQQYPAQSIEQISAEQLEHTFRTNIFSMFYLVKEAMPFLTRGARIINTTSVTAYRGSKHLVDYAATKGPSWPSRAHCHSSWPRPASTSMRCTGADLDTLDSRQLQ